MDGVTREMSGPPAPFAGRYPKPSDKLGRYELLECLGEGGMGCVFRANDPHMKREVALKVLPRDLCVGPQARQRFAREIEIAAKLNLSGVVPVFDHDEAEGWCFYTMALVDGKPLDAHVAGTYLPIEERLRLVVRLARIVARLHEREICHRDLKPSNVMVLPDGELMLIDFGIAKLFTPENLHDLTNPDHLIGTVRYLSPELPSFLHNNPPAVKAGDVYALGVVAYELVAGELPYCIDNLSPIEAFHVICEGAADICEKLPDLPEPIAAAIMAPLALQWDERPDAAEFADDLEAAIEGRAPAPMRRHPSRVGAWLAVAAGLLLLAGAGFYAWLAHTRAEIEGLVAVSHGASQTTSSSRSEPAPAPEPVVVPAPEPAPVVIPVVTPQPVTVAVTVNPPAAPALSRPWQPTLLLGSAPPELRTQWRDNDTDATLVGRGTLLWDLPQGTTGRIRRGDEVLADIDCRLECFGAYHCRWEGQELVVELQLPDRSEPISEKWTPKYDRVDTLTIGGR